jgi:hypothetical protein
VTKPGRVSQGAYQQHVMPRGSQTEIVPLPATDEETPAGEMPEPADPALDVEPPLEVEPPLSPLPILELESIR